MMNRREKRTQGWVAGGGSGSSGKRGARASMGLRARGGGAAGGAASAPKCSPRPLWVVPRIAGSSYRHPAFRSGSLRAPLPAGEKIELGTGYAGALAPKASPQHKFGKCVPKALRSYLQVPTLMSHHYLEVNPIRLGGKICRRPLHGM